VTFVEIPPGTPIEAVVAIAGPTMSAETLRRAANGTTLFFDQEREALIYRGPMPAGADALLPGGYAYSAVRKLDGPGS
jgi:hypothetical protein